MKTMTTIFEYNFNNNEQYEDYDEFSILSFEQIPYREFMDILEKAIDECHGNNRDLARAIIRLDDRFFLPIKQANVAYGYDENNENKYKNKLCGVYYKF